MTVVQVKLVYENTEQVVWIEKDKRVKVGSKITLRENKDKWYEVAAIYNEVDDSILHPDWNVM